MKKKTQHLELLLNQEKLRGKKINKNERRETIYEKGERLGDSEIARRGGRRHQQTRKIILRGPGIV
jgi:hypothetical protein